MRMISLPAPLILRPRSRLGMLGPGHLDRPLVAEEVRGVQDEGVQSVALQPLAAIDQAAQAADLLRDGHPEGVLHRRDRAHLVGDRADAADPRGDVGRVGERAPPQQRLEEARGGS